jgi:hypothetical protein
MPATFYRCYSDTSAGTLVSGQGRGHQVLALDELREQFELHCEKWSTTSTKLISITTSLIRVLHIALTKLVDREPAEKIVIVFISAPPEDKPQYHSAKRLADEFDFEKPHLYSSEYLAEWEIRSDAVQHSITLETLIDRGLFSKWDESELSLRSVEDLRKYIGNVLFNGCQNAYELGLGLGFMARTFGARAPSKHIAKKLLHEIVKPSFVDDFGYAIIRYKPAKIVLDDIEDWLAAYEGIDTAIIDWWLCDVEFIWLVKNHNKLADCERQDMSDIWSDDARYNEKMAELERAIEKDAVKCGL